MSNSFHWLLSIHICIHAFFCVQTLAQDSTLLAKLVDEKWNYRYQIHVGENQTIHRATTMNWALYFSSTQKLYQQKSDRSSCASYTLSDRKIISPILPFGPLSIVSCSETELVLIFDLNSIDQYQFYFTKELVSPNDTFIPKHTLPSVVYHYKNPQQQDLVHQEYLSSIGRKNAIKKKKRNRRVPSNVPKDEPEFLQVELTGGGFRGGLDPVYRNILLIRTDGSLLFEYETPAAATHQRMQCSCSGSTIAISIKAARRNDPPMTYNVLAVPQQ